MTSDDFRGEAITDESHSRPGLQCAECAYINPADETVCQCCNSRLGYVRPSTRPDVEATTGRYRKIRARVEELQAGQVTLDAFTRYLEELTEELTARAQSIHEDLEAYRQDNADEVEAGLDGVEKYEAGVSELWAYTQDLEPSHLEQGLLLVWDGNMRIVEAMRINRENREALAELWDELQQGW